MKRYEVPPPGKAAWVTVALIAGAMPIGIAVAVIYAVSQESDAGSGALIWLFALLIGLAVFAFLLGGLKRREVAFDGRELTVKAAMYTRRYAPAEFDLDAARVTSLREHTEFRPMIKSNGYSLAGFHAGNYYTRGRKRAFALLTSYDRVLVLPTRDGRLLLLSLERPQRLLDDLRDTLGSESTDSDPNRRYG